MEPQIDSKQSKKYEHANTIFYVVVIVLIGLPIWIMTTSPSRHSLPDIASLMVHSQTILNKIPISVVTIKLINKKFLRERLVPDRISPEGSIAYKYDWKVRNLTLEEAKLWESSTSLHDFDDKFSDFCRENGRLYVFLLDISYIHNISKNVNIILGLSRSIYIGIDDEDVTVTEENEDKPLSQIITESVQYVLEGRCTEMNSMSIIQEEKHNIKDSLKMLLNQELDVIINILTEDVDDGIALQSSDRLVHLHRLTNVEFLGSSKISDLLNIRIMSQLVYYAFPTNFINSHCIQSSSNRLFDITNVAQLFNLIESRVVEPDNKQSYHLNVILPSSKLSPIFIFDSKNNAKSSAIVTSYRSGAFFWNKPDDINIAFKAFMRTLIGLPSTQPKNVIRRDIFFSHWEIERVMRIVTLEQLSRSLSSLESIKKLLEKLRNIVILPEIANRMHKAVDYSHKAINELGEGNLRKAFDYSNIAFYESERAFFDPSLLSLLYFPEDQKYAIYFPLFFPVGLPLIISLYYLIRKKIIVNLFLK